MNSIIDYAQQTPQTFREKPFGIPDAMILAQLAYLDFAALPFPSSMSLGEMILQPGWEAMIHISGEIDLKKALFAAVAYSPRFKNIIPYGYRSDLSETEQKQFSAVTFLIEPDFSVVSFRGTDSTVIGWKENLDMSYMQRVPAQKESADYLKTSAAHTLGDIIVTGHSKGGNLAVFSCANCAWHVRRRIKKIYNFDGPGFKEEVYRTAGYRKIGGRITTVIPQSSVVGLLLKQRSDYLIVKSEAKGFGQHSLHSWIFDGGTIDCAQALNSDAVFWDKTLDDWLAGLSFDERKMFVDALYGIVRQKGIQYVDELTEKRTDLLAFARYAVQNMDDKTKALYKKALGIFAEAVKRNIKDDLTDEFKDKLAQFEKNMGLLFDRLQPGAAKEAEEAQSRPAAAKA
jgi:hypothetical protein